MRCFLGIPLSADIRELLCGAADQIRAADRAWCEAKWVGPENLHVTLKFLGDLDQEVVSDIASALNAGIAVDAAVGLRLDGLAAVPGGPRSRMLWATLEDEDDHCRALAASLDELVATFGVKHEQRAFRPHVTMARARQATRPPSGIERLSSEIDGARACVSDPNVTLYESRLTPRGPIYSVIGSWHLRGE